MKVVAINGSPRPEGNTSRLLGMVAEELRREGIEVETVQLGGHAVRGCTGCGRCAKNRDGQCSNRSDVVAECIGKMREADGILIGTPTYFSNVSTEVKALIDRSGVVAGANGNMFARKVGAAVVAVRRAGATDAFDAVNKLFLKSEMVVPGATYWNLGVGREPGEVEGDAEGRRTMESLGRNMAWLLKKLA